MCESPPLSPDEIDELSKIVEKLSDFITIWRYEENAQEADVIRSTEAYRNVESRALEFVAYPPEDRKALYESISALVRRKT